jgi:arsenate reductase
MAEALLRAHGGGRFEVRSAGSIPSGVHPLTLVALDEIGINAGEQTSKHWNTLLEGPPFDYVITVCDRAAQNCPVFPGSAQRIHWSIDDPASVMGSEREVMAAFRQCRDELAARVRRFLHRLEQGKPVD